MYAEYNVQKRTENQLMELASLLGYMLVCSFTPGPGNILSLNTTSNHGWKNSRRLIAGICSGYAIVQALCTVLLCLLSQVFTPLLSVLKYIGGAYMIWLAIHIMRSRFTTDSDDKKPTFLEGFLLQLVNVKIYFYISTLLSAYYIPNIKSAWGLALAGAFTVMIGSIASLTWAFLGVRISSFYSRHYRYINIILGVFLLYCAATIILGI